MTITIDRDNVKAIHIEFFDSEEARLQQIADSLKKEVSELQSITQ